MANWREMLIWAAIIGLGVWGAAQRATPVAAEDPVEIEMVGGPVQGELVSLVMPQAVPPEGIEVDGLRLTLADRGPANGQVPPGGTVTIIVELHNPGSGPVTLRRNLCLMQDTNSPVSRVMSFDPPVQLHAEALEIAVLPNQTVRRELTLTVPAGQAMTMYHVWLQDAKAAAGQPLALASFMALENNS